MALSVPVLPTELVPFVGKPPSYSTKLLIFPGGTRPYYSWSRSLEVDVPFVAEDLAESPAYDWRSLLMPIFEFETPKQGLE
jgi:hypothetical protein